jgi:biofilm PGA synthesis N-glycosyltransferase PgaC
MAEPLAALVVATGDAEALRASLGALASPAARTWCAVSTVEEASAAAGLARVREMTPWPGTRAALARLHAEAAPELGDHAVLVLAAGTVLQRTFVSQAMSLLRSGVAIVMATDGSGPTDGVGLLGRLTSSVLAHAVLPPTSGLVMRAGTLAALADAGWLEGRELRLADVREVAGRVRVLRGGVASYRSPGVEVFGTGRRPTVTVLIPAHNEEAWLGETLRSIRVQTLQPDEVLVVDDCSTDRTSEIARHHGATVLRTPTNRLKAGAQNYGLDHIRTDIVVTLDADTVLHPDAIRHLVADLEAGCDATNGAVMPQSRTGLWTRARLIEYTVAMRLYKRAQRNVGTILVLSGCVAAFHTRVLRAIGGFKERTLTEDLDLTWELHLAGYRVGYAPGALSFPAEPATWHQYKSQVRRWAAGFFQSIEVHRSAIPRNRGLLFIVGTSLWDIITTVVVLAAALVVTVTQGLSMPSVLLWVTLVITIVVPLGLAASVIGVGPAVTSLPAYLIGSWTSQYLYIEALVKEWFLRRRQKVWIKGH